MTIKSIEIAKKYYTAMQEKNIEGMKKYLHNDVELISPLARIIGKEIVVESAQKLITLFINLIFRAQFSSENQAMIIFDLIFSEPIGNLRSASLLTIEDGFIKKIELFYDSRPFDKKKDEIFKQK